MLGETHTDPTHIAPSILIYPARIGVRRSYARPEPNNRTGDVYVLPHLGRPRFLPKPQESVKPNGRGEERAWVRSRRICQIYSQDSVGILEGDDNVSTTLYRNIFFCLHI